MIRDFKKFTELLKFLHEELAENVESRWKNPMMGALYFTIIKNNHSYSCDKLFTPYFFEKIKEKNTCFFFKLIHLISMTVTNLPPFEKQK
jgi:hypothetical protein